MSIIEIFTISGTILFSVGGAAAIIFSLSSWLGKVWANRILESDKLKYSSELENIKTKLYTDAEKQRFIFSHYFEAQFKIYNELWLSLSELQNAVELLWEKASPINLETFVCALSEAKQQIRNTALFIEQNHYKEVIDTIERFQNYQLGKERLIDIRINIDNVCQSDVQKIIDQNRDNRDNINIFVEYMLEEMRRQVSGRQNTEPTS